MLMKSDPGLRAETKLSKAPPMFTIFIERSLETTVFCCTVAFIAIRSDIYRAESPANLMCFFHRGKLAQRNYISCCAFTDAKKYNTPWLLHGYFACPTKKRIIRAHCQQGAKNRVLYTSHNAYSRVQMLCPSYLTQGKSPLDAGQSRTYKIWSFVSYFSISSRTVDQRFCISADFRFLNLSVPCSGTTSFQHVTARSFKRSIFAPRGVYTSLIISSICWMICGTDVWCLIEQ